MKNCFILLLISCLILSCRDALLKDSFHRSDVIDSSTPEKVHDTLVISCAVVYPDQYDWVKDSSYNSVNALLCVYKNDSLSLSVPAGPGCYASCDPDSHLLLNGALYTWTWIGGTNRFCRDGVLLFEYPGGRLIPKGIVNGDGGLYVLADDLNGGILLLVDGQEVFRRPHSLIQGSFNTQGYGKNGALYYDDDNLVFSFKDRQTGICYFYEKGDIIPVCNGQNVIDAKRYYGKKYIILEQERRGEVYVDGVRLQGISLNSPDCYFMPPRHDLTPILVCHSSDSFIASRDGKIHIGTRSCIPFSDKGIIGMLDRETGLYKFLSDGRIKEGQLAPGSMVISSSSVCAIGSSVYIAASKKEKQGLSQIKKNCTRKREYSFNGFFTDVEIMVSHPR